jgi:hypothetical protein
MPPLMRDTARGHRPEVAVTLVTLCVSNHTESATLFPSVANPLHLALTEGKLWHNISLIQSSSETVRLNTLPFV